MHGWSVCCADVNTVYADNVAIDISSFYVSPVGLRKKNEEAHWWASMLLSSTVSVVRFPPILSLSLAVVVTFIC